MGHQGLEIFESDSYMCATASVGKHSVHQGQITLTLSTKGTHVETTYGPLPWSLEDAGGAFTEIRLATVEVEQVFICTSPLWPGTVYWDHCD